MTEQAGHLNAPDLRGEIVEEVRSDLGEQRTPRDESAAWVAMEVTLSVLRKRGLLTIQALEVLASSSIRKPISIPPIRK